MNQIYKIAKTQNESQINISNLEAGLYYIRLVSVEKELIEAYGESAVIDLRTGEVKEPEIEKPNGKDK